MRQSIWLSSKEPFSAPSLQQDLTCEICIVGGGICGVYSAYMLAKQGFSVVLLEALPDVAQGTTAYSTGKLTVQHELIYSKLPLEDARRYYQANKQAIEQVVALNVPSLTEVTSYIYSKTNDGKEQLLKEAKRYDELGIPYTATNETELALPITLALGIPNEAQINPLEFTQHFAQLARQNGAQLFTNTRITTVNVKERTLQTEQQQRITYEKLILCTHYPIESMRNLNIFKLQINRSYLSATKCLDTLQGQYLSIDNPGRTIRTALINGEPYLVYGGFSHFPATARQSDYYETLQQEVQSLFDLPAPEYIWDAQDMTTFDQVPYIGQVTAKDDSLYVATGFNKWGLSSSLVAANLLCDLLKNVPNDAASVFSPSRSNFGKTLYFMLQTGGYVAKEFIKGYVTKMGAPRCTHLGCKTKWNETENTWDCPCHGSRYNAKGEVIEGPAVYPLDIKQSGTS